MPVSGSADYVLCDGDPEESSVSAVAEWRSRRAFDVRGTGRDGTAWHIDSGCPLELSLCSLVIYFPLPDACGSGTREVV